MVRMAKLRTMMCCFTWHLTSCNIWSKKEIEKIKY